MRLAQCKWKEGISHAASCFLRDHRAGTGPTSSLFGWITVDLEPSRYGSGSKTWSAFYTLPQKISLPFLKRDRGLFCWT